MDYNSKFPNGVTDYLETHYEIVAFIAQNQDLPTVIQRQKDQGHGGLYELAEELTDKFEKENKGREWDGEYFEAVYSFCENELS